VRPLLAAAAALLLLAGCGGQPKGGGGGSTDTIFPTLSTDTTGRPLQASASDPTGDAGDPSVDITHASAKLAGGVLTATIEVARSPLLERVTGDNQIEVGAYLLRDQNDATPDAARLLIVPKQKPQFLFGPWMGKSTPIPGSLKGTTITLTVPHAATYRYVTFYGESADGDDVVPDDTPTSSGVLPLN
jgi:hypothetical protein